LCAGLEAHGSSIKELAVALSRISFPAGDRLIGETIRRQARGDQWLDQRDRAVIELLVGADPATGSLAVPPRYGTSGVSAAPADKEHERVQPLFSAPEPSEGSETGAADAASESGEPMLTPADVTGLFESYPAVDGVLDGIPPVPIFFDPEWEYPDDLPDTAHRAATTAVRRMVDRFRRDRIAFYRDSGRLGPKASLPRTDLSIRRLSPRTQTPWGDLHGYIDLDGCAIDVSLPFSWYDQIGARGWALLDRRFVLAVTEWSAERPAVVRAGAMCYDKSADRAVHRDPLRPRMLEQAEIASYQFTVKWSRSGRPRLEPAGDSALDDSLALIV
jgi:hypothetical protein